MQLGKSVMVFLVFRALILSEVGADGNIYRDNLIMKI